ncbi:hypothetical protein OH77DRAFT_457026 [Trametes cingulata]|nr:hypothetical protein OH77DRAFT_457026 [Trametes cingulata]
MHANPCARHIDAGRDWDLCFGGNGGRVSGARGLSALFGERARSHAPRSTMPPRPETKEGRGAEIDWTCHSPSTSRLHCPRRYTLESMITRPRPDFSLQKSATQSVSHRPIVPRPFRTPSVLTDTDGLVSFLAIHEQRLRSNELNADLTQLNCCLLSYWGLGSRDRNEGLWGKGGTSGESAVFYAAGATRTCCDRRRGVDRGLAGAKGC